MMMMLENRKPGVSPTIEGLVHGLETLLRSSKDFAQAERILSQFVPTAAELAPYANFSNDRYCRNLIHRSERFELLLLCWKPGQSSPVHDHRYSWCGVRVIQGSATEVRFMKTPQGTWVPVGHSIAHAGELVCSMDRDTHIIGNFETSDLMTMHCYAPPLKNYEVVPNDQTLGATLSRVYNSLQNDAGIGTIL
ncbi:hypothetical protein EON79_15170 [bacterium]|nr:MAG: hypothetical protein EON79_15170 [bacterium]